MAQSNQTLFTVGADGQYQKASKEVLIAAARAAMSQRLRRGSTIGQPRDAKDFLALRLGTLAREVFCVMFLDAQNRVIEFREMFQGTLTQTAVYPREVVKAALELNAASVILAHNHPSGVGEPSRADDMLTATLKSALGMIDVRVVDHMVVAGGEIVSLAERGMV